MYLLQDGPTDRHLDSSSMAVGIRERPWVYDRIGLFSVARALKSKSDSGEGGV